MTHATEPSSRDLTGKAAQPRVSGAARACTIAFLHVCLPAPAPAAPCQGQWASMAAPIIPVAVRLPLEASAVIIPVRHAQADQAR
ncbi:MAG: hypothetical protein NTV86_10100 [Planctomycetota bacterium]|nr:hypothetical protein [Planctomycetota bacterium]